MSENKYPIGGYAPGNYACICCICKIEFQGDKRAVQCEECALKATEIPAVDHDQAHINMDAGMPDLEAYYQAGFSNGHDVGYDKAKKEPKPAGVVWIKASDYDISKGGVLFYRFNGPTLKSIGIGHFVGDMFYGTHLDVFPKWDWKNLYILNESTPTTNNDHIIAALRKFVSMHETGLLPNRFTYEEGKKALDGLGTNNDAIEFGESDLISFYNWMREYGWQYHTTGYYYRSKYRHDWPPDETCEEKDLIKLWQQSKSKI